MPEFNGEEIAKDWECFSGNDGDLIYWYRCKKCGCVITVDFKDPESVNWSWECPAEKWVNDFIWIFFTKANQEKNPAIKKIIEIHEKLGLF